MGARASAAASPVPSELDAGLGALQQEFNRAWFAHADATAGVMRVGALKGFVRALPAPLGCGASEDVEDFVCALGLDLGADVAAAEILHDDLARTVAQRREAADAAPARDDAARAARLRAYFDEERRARPAAAPGELASTAVV